MPPHVSHYPMTLRCSPGTPPTISSTRSTIYHLPSPLPPALRARLARHKQPCPPTMTAARRCTGMTRHNHAAS